MTVSNLRESAALPGTKTSQSSSNEAFARKEWSRSMVEEWLRQASASRAKNHGYQVEVEHPLENGTNQLPRDSAKQQPNRALLNRQYDAFVREWGYFLKEHASKKSDGPFELDRCLWGALGSGNLLSHGPSQYTSFLLLNEEESKDPREISCFECVNDEGTEMLVVRPLNDDKDSNGKNFLCTRWLMINSEKAIVKREQTLQVVKYHVSLYTHPMSGVAGRPPAISCTSDFRFLRIGSKLFYAPKCTTFVPLNGSSKFYFEEIASFGGFIALATRRSISGDDFCVDNLICNDRDDGADLCLRELFADLDGASYEHPDSHKKLDVTNNSSTSSFASSLASLKIRDDGNNLSEDAESLKLDSESNFSSNKTNSAHESYSEDSASTRSDEIKEWSNFSSESELKIDNELELSDEDDLEKLSDTNVKQEHPVDSDSSDISDADPDEFLSKLEDASKNKTIDCDPSEDEEEDENYDSDSEYEESYYSGSEDDGYGENEGGTGFAAFLDRSRQSIRKCPAHERGRLEIIDGFSGTAVFHFDHVFPDMLFSSPPVFHLGSPLVVWPLCDGEVLFADFVENSYFIRKLVRTASKMSKLASIKCKFSGGGEYLHVAALESQKDESNKEAQGIDGNKGVPNKDLIRLTLHISTHRLSIMNASRVPPRLIFRIAIPLGTTIDSDQPYVPAASFPYGYTLTWSEQYAYLVKSSVELQVIRIPLFQTRTRSPNGALRTSSHTENGELHNHKQESQVTVTTKPIFLPQSSTERAIYYFPPPNSIVHSEGLLDPPATSDPDRKTKSTVIIGSSPVGNRFIAAHEIAAPLGLYLDEETDLGGWKTLNNDIDAKEATDKVKNVE